jgi:hypothetical protein
MLYDPYGVVISEARPPLRRAAGMTEPRQAEERDRRIDRAVARSRPRRVRRVPSSTRSAIASAAPPTSAGPRDGYGLTA